MKCQVDMVLLLCLAVAAAGCASPFVPVAEYPTIAPAQSAGAPLPVDHTFEFEGGAETIGVTIDAGILAGARASEKRVLIRGEVPEDEWIAGAYRAQIFDPTQDSLYADLLARFREVRDERGLDSNRYLELIAAAVQQLRYVTAPGTGAKYPVETWADSGGDCDDKAMLLAGLLAREGYRVALLDFLPESHMALGVGCPDGYDYAGSGYAYLEVTSAAYVGVVPDGVHSASSPLIIPIGDGTTLYGAAPDTTAIGAARQSARERVDALRPEIGRRRAALETDRRRLEVLRSAGNRAAFEAASTQYGIDAAACDRLVDEYNRAVDLLNRTTASGYDRAGAAAYVSAHPP